MFRSNQIRIGQSVLAAQAALVQALEVLFGKEIRLCDLKIDLGKIFTTGGCRRCAAYESRRMTLAGCAQLVEDRGLSAPFRFRLENLPLSERGDWQVHENTISILTTDEMFVGGVSNFNVQWEPGKGQYSRKTYVTIFILGTAGERSHHPKSVYGESRTNRFEQR